MLIRSNISMQTPLQPIQNQFRTLKHHSLRRIISRLSAPSSNKFAAYKMINIRLYYFSKILQIVCDPDVLHTHSLCVRAFVYVGSHWTSSWVAWTVESLTLCWSAKSFATSPWIVESFSFFSAIFCQASSRNTNDGQLKGDEWQIPSRRRPGFSKVGLLPRRFFFSFSERWRGGKILCIYLIKSCWLFLLPCLVLLTRHFPPATGNEVLAGVGFKD